MPKQGKNLTMSLFPAYKAQYRAVYLCYRTKTFTVWLDDDICVIYTFGQRGTP